MVFLAFFAFFPVLNPKRCTFVAYFFWEGTGLLHFFPKIQTLLHAKQTLYSVTPLISQKSHFRFFENYLINIAISDSNLVKYLSAIRYDFFEVSGIGIR